MEKSAKISKGGSSSRRKDQTKTSSSQFFEELTNRLLTRDVLHGEEIVEILEKVAAVFMNQPMLVEVDPPIIICGDIHGQFKDLIRLFNHGGWPPEHRYLFLGDYVDRGAQSIETACLMFLLKIRFSKDFFLLRGNHESSAINRVYGFMEECCRCYDISLWERFQCVFDRMPVSALVAGKILCMHGGLSQELESFDQIRQIPRPADIPQCGILCDLLWADPDPQAIGWVQSNRGVSYRFGPDVVEEFCAKMDIDLIARAHQVVEKGYEFFADNKLVTIFSAPNYCGQFDNSAGLMLVDANLKCRIR
ncbi:hypothetical protein M513_07958, partial [Trichuris suis]